MRLKIELKTNQLKLPIAYKHILQATIYNMLDRDDKGHFYHNQGYVLGDKSYKMFVFSDLIGHFVIENSQIIFNETANLYIDAMDVGFTESIYQFLMNNRYLYINRQQVEIGQVDVYQTPVFKGEQSYTVQTLSPVVAYTSKNKFFTYYKPGDPTFTELVKNNILHKCEAYNYPYKNLTFEIEEVVFEKKRLVRFKDFLYEAHICRLKIHSDYDTFKIIYETGLSAKGSSGFGMIYKL